MVLEVKPQLIGVETRISRVFKTYYKISIFYILPMSNLEYKLRIIYTICELLFIDQINTHLNEH